MTSALTAPMAQACAFVLGCALIHAARAHAQILTRVLVGVIVLAAALVLLVASLTYAPDDPEPLDGISVYAAV